MSLRAVRHRLAGVARLDAAPARRHCRAPRWPMLISTRPRSVAVMRPHAPPSARARGRHAPVDLVSAAAGDAVEGLAAAGDDDRKRPLVLRRDPAAADEHSVHGCVLPLFKAARRWRPTFDQSATRVPAGRHRERGTRGFCCNSTRCGTSGSVPAEQKPIVQLLVERVDARMYGGEVRLRPNGLSSLVRELAVSSRAAALFCG